MQGSVDAVFPVYKLQVSRLLWVTSSKNIDLHGKLQEGLLGVLVLDVGRVQNGASAPIISSGNLFGGSAGTSKQT